MMMGGEWHTTAYILAHPAYYVECEGEWNSLSSIFSKRGEEHGVIVTPLFIDIFIEVLTQLFLLRRAKARSQNKRCRRASGAFLCFVHNPFPRGADVF